MSLYKVSPPTDGKIDEVVERVRRKLESLNTPLEQLSEDDCPVKDACIICQVDMKHIFSGIARGVIRTKVVGSGPNQAIYVDLNEIRTWAQENQIDQARQDEMTPDDLVSVSTASEINSVPQEAIMAAIERGDLRVYDKDSGVVSDSEVGIWASVSFQDENEEAITPATNFPVVPLSIPMPPDAVFAGVSTEQLTAIITNSQNVIASDFGSITEVSPEWDNARLEISFEVFLPLYFESRRNGIPVDRFLLALLQNYYDE